MHAFVGHAAGEERRRQARFRRNAKWVLLLIALQTGVGLFGAYELEKGAAFHRFNHLHVSYAMIFQQQLEALVPPVSSSQRHDLERWVTRIRDQPVACLETAAWYDRIFIRLMGTGRALDLCRVDIEVADEALASLAAARGAQTDDAELLAQLERAAQRFHAHSEEFGPLIRDTVQVMYRTVLLVELLNGGVMLLLGWSLLRGLRRAFDQQEDLRRAADSANATKSRFLANMSHEIRTPLNGILGNLELASGLVRNPEVAEHLSIADRSAQSLLSIIDDVLDIAKIEADKLTLEAIPFDVGTLTKDVERLYRARAQAGALTLEVKGGLETPYRVGDPTRVRQVLSNLVSNALKFTPAGGRIFIEVREDGDRLDLIVADTGAGIPPEKQAAVFRSFEQADTSTTRQFGGSGLGLAIV
ncbi:MAG: ATP-binding protein, partial [Myxococcota bacterium]